MKYCKKCDQTKELSDFGKNKNTADGLQFYCKDCCKATTKRYREANKEKYYASAKRWAKANPERVRSQKKKYYLENREATLENKREYYKYNRASILSYKKLYSQANRGKKNSIEARRHAGKIQRTPDWLTEQQKAEIDNIYWLARDLYNVTGEKYHVDHIIPLQGENISGLHVPWNLQILPADLNIAKSNKYDPDAIYSSRPTKTA